MPSQLQCGTLITKFPGVLQSHPGDTGITLPALHIVFSSTAATRPASSGVDFEGFVDILKQVAEKRHAEVEDTPWVPFQLASGSPLGATCAAAGAGIAPAAAWRARPLAGAAARLHHLLTQNILRGPPGQVAAKTATTVVLTDFHNAAVCMQRFVKPVVARRRLRLLRAARQDAARHALHQRSAVRIQSLWRRYVVRVYVCRRLQREYSRGFDGTTGRAFYVHVATQRRQAHKPVLLRHHTLASNIVMSGRDLTVPPCAYCDDRAASLVCDSCVLPACAPCQAATHAAQPHPTTPLAMCTECSTRPAVRDCHDCGDQFCSSCYESQHGTADLHRYSLIVAECDECHDAPAQRQCYDCNSVHGTLLCALCWSRLHDHQPKRGQHFHAGYAVVSYRTKKMAEGIRNAAIAAAETERRARHAHHLERVRTAQEGVAAARLQCWWKVRQAYRLYGRGLRTRSTRFQLQADNRTRRTLKYKMLNLVCKAPPLPTDSANAVERRTMSLAEMLMRSTAVQKLRAKLGDGLQQLQGFGSVVRGSSWVLPTHDLTAVLPRKGHSKEAKTVGMGRQWAANATASTAKAVLWIDGVRVKLAWVESQRMLLTAPFTGRSSEKAIMALEVGGLRQFKQRAAAQRYKAVWTGVSKGASCLRLALRPFPPLFFTALLLLLPVCSQCPKPSSAPSSS